MNEKDPNQDDCHDRKGKDPKSIRGNKNVSQRISNQNNMKLYISNTENQKNNEGMISTF